LIAEANRLRKYLHEVYLRVIDIERKFERLTHINPSLSKSEIVYQIKEFIRQTQLKIKVNFTDRKDDELEVIHEEDNEMENNLNNIDLNKSNKTLKEIKKDSKIISKS